MSNSLDRVVRAITFANPDRVPIYEQTIFSEVSSELLGRTVETGGGSLHFNEVVAYSHGEAAHKEYVYQMLDDCISLYKELDLDIIRMPWRVSKKPAERIDDYTFRFIDDVSKIWSTYRYNPDSRGFNKIDSSETIEGEQAIERIVSAMEDSFVDAADNDEYHEHDYLFRPFRGVKAIAMAAGGLMIPIEPEYLMLLHTNPELIERLLDVQVKNGKREMQMAADLGATILSAGGDMADNTGPIYSPEMYRRFIAPRIKELTDYAHSLGLFYLYRTDGMTLPIAQELYIDSGIDILGEIDYQAGMRLGEIHEHAPRLCLWGNVDCGQVLSLGSVTDVREHTKRCIEEGYAKYEEGAGGHILGSSNSILHTVPAINLETMIKTGRDYTFH